jgi:DNA polymerase-1
MTLLPDYKQQREAMPEALDQQFPLIETYLRLSGVPVVRMAGEEADDLLAVLTAAARQRQLDVLMATGDKDMFQLVDEHVGILLPNKSDQRMGAAEVEAKTGVVPAQIAEWLALIGDTADNIPGVPGVGPKTAAKLLQVFGSLEAMYARIDEVTPERIRGLLIEHRDAVQRNLGMTQLKADMVIPELETLWQSAGEDASGLLAFYRKMEFKTFARELEHPSLL